MISWAVVAHHERLPAATELAKTIGAVLALDHGDVGPGANHLRAWELTETLDSQWAGVLEDDALPILGFEQQSQEALAAAPEPVASLYLGTSRPKRWQERIAAATLQADRADAHWITAPHTIHAVGIALHADLREDWLDYAHQSKLPIDERMSGWCVARRHRVAYTWPSLIDHLDGPTLVQHRDGHPRTQPRRAWRTGSRTQWASKSIAM